MSSNGRNGILFSLLVSVLISCSQDIHDVKITSENLREVVQDIATSNLSEMEKRNLLAYHEEWMIGYGYNEDSKPPMPDLTVGEILENQRDRKSMQDAHLSMLNKLGRSFFTTDGDIGETMSMQTFAALPITEYTRHKRTVNAQRSASFVLSNFRELYHRLPPHPEALATDTLTPGLRLANGVIMETP
ncbi:MAG: hypothetical protein M5R41_13060 [Bacteroidia bacterium]|nr:hypothetical protein [Bacteroidia bacterium]